MADERQKPRFDASKPNALDVVRGVLLDRIRNERSFNEFKPNDFGGGFLDRMTFATDRDRKALPRFLLDAFWSLVMEGLIAPGSEKGDPNLAFFHVTEHGKRVFTEPDYQPHDPAEYLRQLGVQLSAPDPTVLAYLRESLHCYTRGLMVASTMMLGIAAERVFLLICDSLIAALAVPAEQAAFQKILDRNAMKRKLDWVSDKIRQIQTPKRPPDLPEDVDIKIPGIFNLIRCQRNDIGHPRPSPPTVTRDDAYGYLRLFPSYYATAEKVREFLSQNKV
jgi:hypothetical protein